jgi:peptidoglycan/xylan/chitin deacetylase (PgdA/CDA1 family)
LASLPCTAESPDITFTLTTHFAYPLTSFKAEVGDGARHTVEVVGHGTVTYTLDYGRGNRVLAETMPTSTVTYLYGHDCLGESRDDEWLYYLNDGIGYVRQGADAQGQAVSSWLFDPDGVVLEGPQGPVSHLICGGVYDWSTGLIHRDGRYFDPMLGIWLALAPLVVVQSWKGRKRKRRRGMPWYVLVLVIVGVGSGALTACGSDPTSTPGGDIPTPTADSDQDFCHPIYLPIAYAGPPQPESSQGESSEASSSKVVYLTFDDGPEFDHFSKAIAETLAGDGIQATFFLLATLDDGTETISNLKSDVVAIRDAGHAIGIHGWSHRPWNSFPEYLDEIKMTHQALTNALGTLNDKLLRSPGGGFPPEDEIPFEGYEDWYYYHWSIDPGDGYWDSAEDVVDRVKEAIGAGPDSANVLLHSNRPGTHKAIVNPESEDEDLIKVFREAGYTEFKKLPRPGDSPGILLH